MVKFKIFVEIFLSTHRTYSYDLTPSHCFLFLYWKQRFETDKQVMTVNNWLNGHTASFYANGLKKLTQHYEKRLDVNYDFVENWNRFPGNDLSFFKTKRSVLLYREAKCTNKTCSLSVNPFLNNPLLQLKYSNNFCQNTLVTTPNQNIWTHNFLGYLEISLILDAMT